MYLPLYATARRRPLEDRPDDAQSGWCPIKQSLSLEDSAWQRLVLPQGCPCCLAMLQSLPCRPKERMLLPIDGEMELSSQLKCREIVL